MRNVSRESFKENQEKQTVLFAQARLLSSLVAATLNLLVIVLLNKLYEYVALWLVNWEQPRTQTEFEHSYTFKMFLFQFINFYLPLIYIALFKVSIRSPPHLLQVKELLQGKFFAQPGNMGQEMEGHEENFLSGYSLDGCDSSGCFFELSIQLMVVMTGKQLMNNAVELVIP